MGKPNLKESDQTLGAAVISFADYYNDKTPVEPGFNKPLPPASQHNQHLVGRRIAAVMLANFNNEIATYLQAKNQDRYKESGFDLLNESVPVLDEAKNALFENLCWVFRLSPFDHVSFNMVCAEANDDEFGDAENVRLFLGRSLKDEIREMVTLIRWRKGEKFAKGIAEKLSEYVDCSMQAKDSV